MNHEDVEVTLKLTGEQAEAVKSALDLYARIGLGQIEEVADLLRGSFLVPYERAGNPRRSATGAQIEAIETMMRTAKSMLGFPTNGSFGIAHEHVDPSAKRAWEIRKALAKAIAVHRDPDPGFKGVDYDGNLVRLTDDPLPIVTVDGRASAPAPR